eukprot:jgi/Ulvmu1/4735/UM020_0019.1
MLEGQHKVGVVSLQFHRIGRTVDPHARGTAAPPPDFTAGAGAAQLLLLSGGADHTVCLWDVMRSACLQRLTCHAGPVTCVRAVGSIVVTVAEGDCGLVHTLGPEQPGKRHAMRTRTASGSEAVEVKLTLRHSVHRSSSLSLSSAIALSPEALVMGSQCGDIVRLDFR